VTKPYPPLYLGGGIAGFRRIAELGTGWMSLSASAEAISAELEKLRDLAGREVQ
jgi:alkanesulfonate monooxygenase SsuD/methylene tetrahydromethanopterin reductase-like flavin-dependent oxidoreductase (luciferase family)